MQFPPFESDPHILFEDVQNMTSEEMNENMKKMEDIIIRKYIELNKSCVNPYQWINVKDQCAPKKGKFFFHYFGGMGLAEWGTRYEDRNNNSEYAGECYHLVLSPSQVNGNSRIDEVMEFDDNKMIEMEMKWMLLPEPPK
jgi:hypothetical protein